jgi:hypothetical protein
VSQDLGLGEVDCLTPASAPELILKPGAAKLPLERTPFVVTDAREEGDDLIVQGKTSAGDQRARVLDPGQKAGAELRIGSEPGHYVFARL